MVDTFECVNNVLISVRYDIVVVYVDMCMFFLTMLLSTYDCHMYVVITVIQTCACIVVLCFLFSPLPRPVHGTLLT